MAPWNEHDRHRRSRPPVDGLVKLGAVLGGGTPRVVRRLGGGLGSATHLLVAGDRRVVLKRYPPGSEVPALEWEGLTFARDAGLLAPAPIALDQAGDWFGGPALAMEASPGHPDLSPTDPRAFVEEVATALAGIHAADTAAAVGALLRPHAADRWTAPDDVPDGLIRRRVAERIVEALVATLDRSDRGGTVLNHGDFHPGNLLWRRNQLTAVVDWSHTRLGPRWWELAYFRIEVAVLADGRAADRLLERYETLTGTASPDQPVWDLLCLYNAHRWGHLWLMGYREQGRRDLTIEAMGKRVTRLAERALASIGG